VFRCFVDILTGILDMHDVSVFDPLSYLGTLWVKRSGREADQLPPSSAEVKNEWNSVCLHDVVLY
jgi:hypothetical protein